MVKLNIVTATVNRRRAPAPPVGVVASITAGFETVNAQFGLVLLPLALDLLLWLGPRLSLKPLMLQALALWTEALTQSGEDTRQTTELLRQMFTTAGDQFNLFSRLSTAPLGLPSLLATLPATSTPLGPPIIWPISNIFVCLLLFGVLLLVGLWGGALYFGSIAQQVRDARLNVEALLRQVWPDWLRLSVLAVLLGIVLFALGGPVLVVSWFLELINPLLGGVVTILGATLILWVVLFGGFAPHGLVLQRVGFFQALVDSLRLVQMNLPQTAGLFATIMLLNVGLGFVWSAPPASSWWLLVGIVGHAVVSTALVAATFVFYKDRYRWWKETQQALQSYRRIVG